MLKRVVHPGEILKDELEEMGVSPTAFARQIDVPPNRISQIIAGKRSITGDTALRFGHWFGTDPLFWLNLQTQFDLVSADRKVGGDGSRLADCRPAMNFGTLINLFSLRAFISSPLPQCSNSNPHTRSSRTTSLRSTD